MFFCRLYARWVRFWHINDLHLPYEVLRLMVQVLPHPRPCHARLAGFEMALNLRDTLQTNIMLDGVWHPHVSRWMAASSISSRKIQPVCGSTGRLPSCL